MKKPRSFIFPPMTPMQKDEMMEKIRLDAKRMAEEFKRKYVK